MFPTAETLAANSKTNANNKIARSPRYVNLELFHAE